MKQDGQNIILSIDEYNEIIQNQQKYIAENLFLKEELAQLKRMIFGKKNERFVSENQDLNHPTLFDNIEEQVPEKQEIVKEEISYQRVKKPKKKPVRKTISDKLPREEEIIEPENLPENSQQIGVCYTEIYEYEPGRIFVRRIARPKYVIKSTTQDQENQIVIADLPSDLPLHRANAGAGLLSHLFVSKYVDHLPFYRQCQIFKRQDVELSESTINDWFKAVCKLLEPLYDTLKKEVQQSSYIQADESPIPVQTKDKPGATHKGYQWVYHSPPNKIVFFDYQKGRDQSGPKNILKNFKGTLQTDGYAVYNNFGNSPNIIPAACWAHVRRKFEQSLKTYPAVAEHVMTEIQKLYAVERNIREDNLSESDILDKRKKESAPIVESLEKYFKEQKNNVLPKSDIGKAINYAISLMPRLKIYLNDAKILMDNNLVENTIRPLALGRKNYLFAGSHDAAQRTAMMYSFFGTCKLNNVEPFEWLKSTLKKISDHSILKLKELIPGHKS